MLVRPRTLVALLLMVSCGDSGGGSGAGSETDAATSSGGGEDTTGAPTTSGEETGEPTTGTPVDPELFPGLDDEVEILIDKRGIPHIYGASDRDVFYAAGYQMASDRMFEMDLMRRRAFGRGSEVLGSSKVDEDKISRLFDFPRWGAANAERLRDENVEGYGLFVAWVAGVNARIDEVLAGEQPLPVGFGPDEANYAPERWHNVDPFVIAKMLAFGNSNTLEYEFLTSVVERTSPDAYAAIELIRPGMATFAVPPEDRPDSGAAPHPGPKRPLAAAVKDLPPDAAASLKRMHDALAGFTVVGSNNWAVDGRFTASGRPLIANDPHQPLQSPSVMYAMHMNSADAGGQIDAAGFGFAGAPGVQLGHNRHIQWAATTGFADCMDLYSVATAPDLSTVTIGGVTAPVSKRSEEIKVKGEPAVVLEVGDVEGYGVLLGDALPFPEAIAVDAGRHILLNWTGFRPTNEAAAFMAMARAESIPEWEQAVDLMEVGTFNWLAADADGVSYHLQALIPDRGDPSARPMPFKIVDGDDPAYVWSGQWLPASKLPRSHAEATGFIVTANNDPFGFTADGDVGNDPWYYGAFYDPGYRAARIEKRLKQLTGEGMVTVADMQELQVDTYSGVADQLLPVLAGVYASVPSEPELAEFDGRPDLDTLVTLLTVDWNRRMDMGEPGALVFHMFAHFLAAKVYSDDLPLTFGPIFEASGVYGLKFTALAVTGEYALADDVLQQGRDLLVMRALADTAAWLMDQYGTVNPAMYSWGERHGTGFRNAFGGPLDGGWVATHGGEDTVNVSGSDFFAVVPTEPVAQFESHDGAVFRVVTQFLEDGTPEAYVNFPRGNSGDPSSPHWGDTLEDWRQGVYTKYPYTRAEVEAAQETRLVLRP
ncbi:MAG: penicillin acylase family protein [Myxococcales bacterium]|nr:penicillin acylase family protein [Myxococcales bacterium]